MSYKYAHDLYSRARHECGQAGLSIYERFCQSPEASLRAISERWGIDFDEQMLDWGDYTAIPLDPEGVEAGHYARVTRAHTIEPEPEDKGCLDIPQDELDLLLASKVEEIYNSIL